MPTDNFTTGADAALATYSANWTVEFGAITVLAATDDFRGNNFEDDGLGRWNAVSFAAAQYSQITVSAASGNAHWIGAATRIGNGTGGDGYAYNGSGSGGRALSRLDNGVATDLAFNASNHFATSDTVRLESNGNTHTPILNGSTDAVLGAQSDSTYTTGSAGIYTWNNGGNGRGDNWDGGDLGGGSKAPPLRRKPMPPAMLAM